ncbi:hypothetical protein ASG43_03310 [Aureimonas sp. Leaf454]|uniref:hypothetical protein n=1 Tax=Aureimonas sp. Leaf454 TaxID=1736381 RepID=UPI0006F8F322|nr:hypothetical protein [Aureimonas sp. Leaf454]KQT54628.1 hypothetical protein ASG43_03310 [Aureimonas sp. Leaf454]
MATNQYIYELTDSWNSIGTSYNGIKINVSDAASAPDSKLLNLQIGGVAKFTVDKLGNLVAKSIAITDAMPIASGGTGGKTAAEARTALGLDNTYVAKAGDRLTGSLSPKVVDHGTKASVTEEFKYADGNVHKVTVAGSLVINPTGMVEGDVMQINLIYSSGSISISGTTYWELGAGTKSTAIADTGVVLTAGTPYRLILEIVADRRTAAIQ